VAGTETEEEEGFRQAWVGSLGLEVWVEEGRTRGRAELRPEMWAPGTQRPRLGVLATMVDMVGGMPPTGAMTPTVDLRITLLADPPSVGTIEISARTLKLGRRLYSGEVMLYSGSSNTPFARGAVTFVPQVVDIPTTVWTAVESGPLSSFDDLLQLRFPDEDTVVIDAHLGVRNGLAGTIQGGAQATVAEVAAERALAHRGPHHAVDLDIRYLNPLTIGPMIARAEVLGDEPVVRVPLVDGGADGRIVSMAIVVCRPR
jgi:acyl-coenzyme A thioesterase PaaI-like protein